MLKSDALKINGFDHTILLSHISYPGLEGPHGICNPLAQDVDPVQRQIDLYMDEIEAAQNGPDTPVLGSGVIHVGIDVEFEFDPQACRQSVLSYQYYVITPIGEMGGILYPRERGVETGRVEFERFVSFFIQAAMAKRIIEAWPGLVCVYAHFLRADITHFKSFWKRKRDVSAIRRTVASIADDYVLEDGAAWHRPSPVIRCRPLILLAGGRGFEPR